MELKLQAEESFVLKVVQLEELLQVRHSVFVIGNTGCGKSQVVAKLSPKTRGPLLPQPRTPGAPERLRVPAAGRGCTGPISAGAEVAQQDVPDDEAAAGHCGPRPKGRDLR